MCKFIENYLFSEMLSLETIHLFTIFNLDVLKFIVKNLNLLFSLIITAVMSDKHFMFSK